MIILAFDSTAKAASVAVCKDTQLLALYNIDNGLTQSELLLPMAESVLKSLHLTFNDVELYTASVGPGSFTGVRIGAALVKGLAFGKNVPCVEVSTLEALAYNALGLDGIIVPVMDARRNQVYTALFESSADGITRISEDEACSIDSLADALRKFDEKRIYLVGDGYEITRKSLIAAGLNIESTPPLLIQENAYSCARVALLKYQNSEYTSDLSFAPSYLRLPQAERERLEKLKSQSN